MFATVLGSPKRWTPLVRLPKLLAAALVAGLWINAVVCESLGQDKSLRPVGIAKVDITPGYPIRLNGFGFRREESEGVRQRIWAKAIAFESDDSEHGPAVLIAIDSLGVRLPMVDRVAEHLLQKFGIERDRVCLTFSHSHTTPKVNGAADNIFSSPIPPEHQEHIDRYTDELQQKLIEVAEQALTNRKPCQLHWGVGEVTFAVNRRTEGGPVDHDLPILSVRDAEGELVGVYVSYACHCVTLSENLIGGDWAGYAQEAIERRFPGCIALVSIGAGSDSNPSSGVTGDRHEIAAIQGAEIGDEVARLIGLELKPLVGALATSYSLIDIALTDLPTQTELEAIEAAGGAPGYNASTHLARIEQGKPLISELEYPIQVFEFDNELAMVFLAGEVCVDYSIRLKRELDRSRLWLNAYSNDFCAYIPSERLLREGGYGGGAEIPYFALPTSLEAGLEDQIVNEVKRQVPDSFHAQKGTQGIQPLSPAASIATMNIDERFEVQLVASEPLVRDPVAIDFGADGRLWVAEMPDYSRAVDASFEQRGTVKLLTDSNEDGRYDESIVFADGLRFPTDVKAWRDGVLICDAPDILFARDVDGDGVCDERRIVVTGFATHNPHARVNSLRWGLDGWLYGSCGLFGGSITNRDGTVVDLGGRDFRLNPDVGKIEPASGKSQQGRDRNDFGDWFGCDNGTLIRHYPVVAPFAQRNPYVVSPPTSIYVPRDANAGQLFPSGEVVTFKLSGPPGRPTSVCGLGVYRDQRLGKDFDQNIFVCEPVNQLIHRQILTKDGVSFAGRRAPDEQEREFLAASDRWFRPVQVRTGPDGGLWVVDMYRYVIEHARWIPEETRRELDLFAGTERGRIYRIVPREGSNQSMPALSGLSPRELVQAMNHSNGVIRDMAHQLIGWHHHEWSEDERDQVADDLAKLVRETDNPAIEVQSLACLATIRRADAVNLQEIWLDSIEAKTQAILALPLIHPDLKPTSAPGRFWTNAFLSVLKHPPTRLSLHCAYALGEFEPEFATPLILEFAAQYRSDAYLYSAVLSSITEEQRPSLLHAIKERLDDPQVSEVDRQSDRELVRELLVGCARSGTAQQHQDLFEILVLAGEGDLDSTVAFERISDLFRQFREHHTSLIESLLPEQVDRLALSIASARQAIGEPETMSERVTAAIDLIGEMNAADGLIDRDEALQLLLDACSPRSPKSTQIAAIEALSVDSGELAFESLLAISAEASPSVQIELQAALTSKNEWIGDILDRIKEGTVPRTVLARETLQQLESHPEPSIRTRAGEVARLGSTTDRAQVVSHYLDQMAGSGNPLQGRIVFAKHCAKCHQLEGIGESIGPDLAALTNRGIEPLLSSILDPSQDVDRRYAVATLIDQGGRVISGLVTEESELSFTVRTSDLQKKRVLRSSLESVQVGSKSFMANGLEEDIGPAAMADLLAYLEIVGQESSDLPSVIERSDDNFVLPAAQAVVRGQDILFEGSPFENIGYWHHQTDRVSWTIDVPVEERVLIRLIYACAPAAAGNTLRIQIAGLNLDWVVESTGGWDQYRTVEVGTLALSSGRHLVEIFAALPIDVALLDLVRVELLSMPLPDENANRVERWSAYWKADRERMLEGALKAEAFRTRLLASADSQRSQFDLLIEEMIRFQEKVNKELKGRPTLNAFELNESELTRMAKSDERLREGRPFASFDGRWYGTWDRMNVDHWWHPTEILSAPYFSSDDGPAITQLQFAWIGDGFGWNYAAKPKGETDPVILGMVYHVHADRPDAVSMERPHLGLSMGNGKLIWITAGEVFFEEAFESEGTIRYAITGFYYEIVEGEVRRKGDAFQAIYSRDPDDRVAFHQFR